jgi:hypothetical protein
MITGDLIRLFVVAQDLWSLASFHPRNIIQSMGTLGIETLD